jgi:hypothetical protein
VVDRTGWKAALGAGAAAGMSVVGDLHATGPVPVEHCTAVSRQGSTGQRCRLASVIGSRVLTEVLLKVLNSHGEGDMLR